MVSTNRLIILILMFNLAIGISGEIYMNSQVFDYNELDLLTNEMDNTEGEFESEEGIWGSVKSKTERFVDNTIGNPIRLGFRIYNFFMNGINPFSFTPDMFENQVEKEFARIIVAFRTFLMLILAIHLYQLIFSNKTD